jgi:L-asparaginase II
MRDAPGWIAKGGAEGLLCAAGPDRVGVALKAEDGSARAQAPALAAFLGRLGVDLPGLAKRQVLNTRGEGVGEIVTRS